jgi:hypothetical protein
MRAAWGRTKWWKRWIYGIVGFLALVIVLGVIFGKTDGTTTSTVTKTVSVESKARVTANATHPKEKVVVRTRTVVQLRTVTNRVTVTDRVTVTAASREPLSPPVETPAACSPMTDSGNCYEPGEYCRDDDHGVAGVDGDGDAITCEDNDGWRWEQS